MKELNNHIQEEIELRIQNEQKKGVDFIGSIVRHPGHTIWQLNIRTQDITPAEFDEEVIDFNTGKPKRKIIQKSAHWYCSALNKESAFRRFNKMAKEFVEKQQSILQ